LGKLNRKPKFVTSLLFFSTCYKNTKQITFTFTKMQTFTLPPLYKKLNYLFICLTSTPGA